MFIRSKTIFICIHSNSKRYELIFQNSNNHIENKIIERFEKASKDHIQFKVYFFQMQKTEYKRMPITTIVERSAKRMESN